MNKFLTAINQVPLGVIVILCATLGLAPFAPPHVIEKLSMLANGNLVKPIDWFDLCFHGAPWMLLLLKVIAGRIAAPDKSANKT